MVDRKHSTPPPPPPRTASGEHQAVKAMRAKAESIADTDSEELAGAFAALDRIKDKSTRPPPLPPDEEVATVTEDEIITPLVRDSRREATTDPRRDYSIPPVDIVEPDPFPRRAVPRPTPKKDPR